MNRRDFIKALAAAGALGATSPALGGRADYRGPNVIFVRFGGGVRRRETLVSETTYSPFLAHELVRRGTLFDNMEIASLDGVQTSHAQGTLYLLTGRYHAYEDVENRLFGDRFEPPVPTLFEYLRRTYGLAAHETVVVNNENRPQEEFLSFSTHPDYGEPVRATMLSRYRFQRWALRQRVIRGEGTDPEQIAAIEELRTLRAADYRTGGRIQGPQIDRFWQSWAAYWGETGHAQPRGDRLLTELARWALAELRPRFLMVNYNDCDYVHWGNPAHYTEGIAVMDQGLRELVSVVEDDPFYRDNTVFVVSPDCGRDDNPLMAVPYQHHFGDATGHEVFALFFGTGIARGQVIDRPTQQVDVAPTLAGMMGLEASYAEGEALEEAWA